MNDVCVASIALDLLLNINEQTTQTNFGSKIKIYSFSSVQTINRSIVHPNFIPKRLYGNRPIADLEERLVYLHRNLRMVFVHHWTQMMVNVLM